MDATATRDRSRRAVRAAVVVAAEHGLAIRDAVVLKDGSNLTVELLPAGVVARVATGTGVVRDAAAYQARELAIAAFLADAGAPVIAPSREVHPGPHERDGLSLTFWERVERLEAPADPAAAAAALRVCHDAFAGYDGELVELALLVEARALLDRLIDEEVLDPRDAAFLSNAADELIDDIQALGLPFRPVHGDAYLRNVVNTPAGPLWADWEDAFSGPLEWDLACLVARGRVLGNGKDRGSEALEAYGVEVNDDLLQLFVEARTLQAIAWGLLFSTGQPRHSGSARARMRWLRSRLATQTPRS